MTAVLERVAPATPPLPPRHPSRLARWWSSWRVAIRLARRDAWRGKGRAALVLLLIALPVAAVVGGISYVEASNRVQTARMQALLSLGATSDARVSLVAQKVVQSVDLSAVDGVGSRASSAAELTAALPSGSRLVALGGSAGVILEAGPWGVSSYIALQDTRDALVAGLWRVLDGRLPTTATEIALDRSEIQRLHADLGADITLTTTNGPPATRYATLVGVVEPFAPASVSGLGVVLPGLLPESAEFTDAEGIDPKSGPGAYLVASPRALTWSDVRSLNALGASVAARTVLESPPSFCPISVPCLDSGPAPQPVALPDSPSPDALANAARAAALAGVVLVLIVLQVALLAGPAFAVQLRRRQRELGLVGASGGTAADLRRAVLASGIVLGVAGGLLGITLGWSAVLLLGGLLPWAPLSVSGVSLGIPPLPWYVLGIAAIGVTAAVVASLVPAVLAGKGDVVDSLRGRRPLPALRTRTPVLGLLVGVVGILLVFYGRSKPDAVILGLGIIGGELGLVLVMPWLVVQAGRLGRWAPLSTRMAMRDSGRHRLRTAAAACAIAAASASAVAVSTWASTNSYVSSQTDVAVPPGIVAVQVYSDPAIEGPSGSATLAARTTAVIDRAVPGSTTAALVSVVPRSAPVTASGVGLTGAVSCLSPYTSEPGRPRKLLTEPATWGPCVGRQSVYGSMAGEVVVLDDPADLGLLLGPLPDLDAARAELAAGGAVVLQPYALDPKGQVWLQPSDLDVNGNPVQARAFAVPGVEVLTGALPSSVILGPSSLAPGGAAERLRTEQGSQVIYVKPGEADSADRPTAADAITLALAKYRITGGAVQAPDSSIDPRTVTLAALAGGTLLLALLAGLMVTALALADGRADIVTLAAVGAEPRVRRRIAASSAGFVAALGCAAGAVSGLVLAWLLNPLFSPGGPVASVMVVSWWLVAFVLLGIPALTAGVAWLTTRSTITLTRRRD
jgi:putative ABC transport system permease protein